MDTKLKNNKKAKLASVAVAALAALLFVSVAINYKDNVDSYYIEYGSDFEGENYIRMLVQSNYVLYTEVLKKGGVEFKPDELYLSIDEQLGPAQEVTYYGNETDSERTAKKFRTDLVLSVQQSLDDINERYTTKLGSRMDYCVIDGDTSIILKNTARKPEFLVELSGNSAQATEGVLQETAGDIYVIEGFAVEGLAEDTGISIAEEAGYAYYIIMRYNQNGVLSDIRTYGSDSERFLKNAQLVASSTDSFLFADSRKVEHFTVTDEGGDLAGRVTVTEKNPRNATFIYAMTPEQMANFEWNEIDPQQTRYIGIYSKEAIYDNMGIGMVYVAFLVMITCAVFFMARQMPLWTCDTVGTRLCAEVIFAILFVLAVVLNSRVTQMVYMTNELSGGFAYDMRYSFLFGLMFVLFLAWYWCLLSIRGIFCDFGAFVRERSLIYRNWNRLKEFFGNIRDKWRAELAAADLGRDNTRLVGRLVMVQFAILAVMALFGFFSVVLAAVYSIVLYVLLRRYLSKVQKQYKNVMQAAGAIAQGKFDNDFDSDFGMFESCKDELYKIQDGFGRAVEDEVKSQRMKTELITNVSHDLKTPLTAIITYIDLLKGENITDEQRKDYIDTLERKSLRLKISIEDLFEISKASSGNVKLELVSMDICSLVRQVYLEHEEEIEEKGLDMRFQLPEEKVILQLDSQKTYRIFENLYVNIIKYAMPVTRVYVKAEKTESGGISIEMKNISEQELTVSPTDLTERFVRGDVSRNTEGSGLGLAIAKSFTQLQGGQFGIEIDGDLFKVIIKFDIENFSKKM